ncbi:hypothetical protein ANN_11250 [Periplaneta americana]|uniref:Mos1 transposase HTH domain-containing protein n=1 Tax=Periplaneta americana TaxID=6978 RepID=A0ABQ8T685_PERAM|nr:hypothetical protein ANN_11250 [Periplaneta americana]
MYSYMIMSVISMLQYTPKNDVQQSDIPTGLLLMEYHYRHVQSELSVPPVFVVLWRTLCPLELLIGRRLESLNPEIEAGTPQHFLFVLYISGSSSFSAWTSLRISRYFNNKETARKKERKLREQGSFDRRAEGQGLSTRTPENEEAVLWFVENNTSPDRSRLVPVAWQQWSEMEALIPSPAACEVRSVIKFFTAQSIAPIEIHRQLCQVYRPNITSKQMVRRWCRQFSEGRQSVHDEERSGRPSLINDDRVELVRQCIMENRRFMITELSSHFPQISRSLLHEIVTKHLLFKKSVCQTLSVRKVMCTVFWDRKGILLIDFLPRVIVHVFLHLKKFLSSGERFGNDEELKTSVTRWFHSQAAEFYDRGIQKLIPRYDKCLNSDGGYVEK